MDGSEAITGAEWLARTLAANGTTHVFFIDSVLRHTLIELGTLGVARVLAHAEKSAAYMADGYARIAGRPGICFAQSVGAANLAAGLQDVATPTFSGMRRQLAGGTRRHGKRLPCGRTPRRQEC